MAGNQPQSLKKHTRIDPAFHYVIVPILALNFIFSIVHLAYDRDLLSAWFVIVSFALVLMAFLVRIYPLRVQDRVIRLEERLRLSMLLPEPLRMRIRELNERQLVALRFAPDAELSSLVEQTLNEKLAPPEIKKLIADWRPDHLRV